jgi:hypothetical protein
MAQFRQRGGVEGGIEGVIGVRGQARVKAALREVA